MAGAGAVAPAAAAPQAHLGTPPACLPAHLPVPTAHEAELLRQLDVPTVNISPACMQLSGKEKQLLQKTLNDLSFGLPVIVETTETTDEARNVWQQQPFKRTSVAIGHDASSKLLACSRPCTSSNRPATTS